jgi:hypothetical protein
MRAHIPLLVALLSLVRPGHMHAHPVAFEGSTQVMGSYTEPMSTFEAYHTYAANVAFGLDAELMKMPGENLLLTALQHNWLVKRWNAESSQANFYAGVGAGVASAWSSRRAKDTDPYGRVAVQLDYETLWVYTAVKSAVDAGQHFTFAENTVSLGFAPYAHDYDGLATWLIVDFTYVTEFDHDLRIIPKIRLFKNSWFIEAGCSLDGDPFFSCMFHF